MADPREFGDWTVFHTPTLGPNVSWQPDQRFDPEQLATSLAPRWPQARVRIDYGEIGRRDSPLIAYEPRNPNWMGQYFRVTSTQAGVDFAGVVTRVSETPAGDTAKLLGTQSLVVEGFEWLLARYLMGKAWYYHPTLPEQVSEIGAGVNTGYGYQRDTASSNAGNKDTRGLLFSSDPAHREAWTALTYMQYLIQRDLALALPRAIELAPGAADYLDFTPVVRTEGRSLHQVIGEILHPRRGLCWWIDWPGGGAGGQLLRLNVQSYATTDIFLPSVGGATTRLPANSDQRNVSGLEEEAALRIETRDDRRRSQMVVRGARQRAVYTALFSDGALAPGWSTTLRNLYRDGGKNEPNLNPPYEQLSDAQKAALNDEIRDSNALASVYTRYVVPSAWDGFAGEWAISRVTNPDTGSPTFAPYFVPAAMRLCAETPLIAGLDYTNPSSPTGDPAGIAGPEYVKPFAFVDIGQSASPFYRLVENVANREAIDGSGGQYETSYSFGIAPGAPGIIVAPQIGANHALALGDWDASAEPSETDPQVDYNRLGATLCAELASWCEGRWPEDGDYADRMLIYIGDRARYDTMTPGTVWGVRNGQLQTATHQEGADGILRDDRFVCRALARIAFQWYGVPRATFSLVTKLDQSANVQLGTLVGSIGFDTPAVEVNAIVSAIEYDFEQGRIAYQGGFEELDFTL